MSVYIIHPYYTGRDKGPVRDGDGKVLTFRNEGCAWMHVFTVLQPNDPRAADNYRVLRDDVLPERAVITERGEDVEVRVIDWYDRDVVEVELPSGTHAPVFRHLLREVTP